MTSDRTPRLPTSHRSAERGALRPFFLTCVLIAAIVISLVILKDAPAPFFWIFLTWAAALFAAMIGVAGSWPRAILFNLGILALVPALAEAYLIKHEYAPVIFPPGFWVRNDVLGWAPGKGMKFHVSKPNPPGLLHGSRGMLFDRVYTIDPNGFRVAPPWRKDNLAGTILFFGCSFTFGEGLNDDETLPYQVGLQSEGRYRTYNFAFEAYGPNQMLAQIDHGIVKREVDSTPQYAFYVAIPDHVWRVAGRLDRNNQAPRYVLRPDGSVQEAGYFDNREALNARLGFKHGVRQLNKSAIWRMLSTGESRITDDDIRLCLAVVRRSQELLVAQYPGIQFRVILWPNQHVPQQREAYEKLRDGFRKMGIPLDLVEEILPNYNVDRSPYILGSTDHHPNAFADRLLAQYIVRNVLVPPEKHGSKF